MSRFRSISTTSPQGTWTRFGDNFGGGTVVDSIESITDETLAGDNWNYQVTKLSRTGGRINKPSNTSFSAKFNNYLAVYLNDSDFSSWGHASIPGSPSNTTAATLAAARTNPNRPYVDIPVAIAELGDITKLIRDSGRRLYRKLAGANIKYQFGIAPLASDIAKLTRFQEAVNSRCREIERLCGPKGLRRTVSVFKGQNYYVNSDVYFNTTGGVTIRRHVHVTSAEEVRGHCRWRPAYNINHLLAEKEILAQIKAVLLGLNGLNFSTLWELIPWSWLIDWGTTIGPYLMANRNGIPAVLTSTSVVRHQRTEHAWAPYSNGEPAPNGPTTMTGGMVRRETKSRQRASIAPTAHFQILSGKQMGILGSLSVLRGR